MEHGHSAEFSTKSGTIGGEVRTKLIFPGGSLRWMAATLTCVTAILGWVIIGRIEQGVPSGLC
jgi:hypothetical protein